MKIASILFVSLASCCSAFTTTPIASRNHARIFGARAMTASLYKNNVNVDGEQDTNNKKFYNPTPVLWSALKEVSSTPPSSSSVSTALAVMLLSFSLMTMAPDAAWAARSGGRMGGSFRSASPMRSAPSRSYGGGGGGGYYGGGGGYRGGGGGVIVAPMISPYYSPMYGGIGGGGVMAVSRGPSIFDLLFLGGFAFVALNAFTSATQGIAGSGTGLFTDSATSVLGNGVTIAKISIALDVPNRDDDNSIISVLDQLAQTARTDSRVGIQNLSSQVALALLRKKSSIVSGFSESQHFNDKSMGLREYSRSAVQERGKFEQETISQYGGVDYSVKASSSSGDGKATMAVVTLLIAIDGDSTELPKIRSISDVEEALRVVAADVKVDDCLQSTEILWTPQDRSETLTPREVIADYPELISI